MAQIPAPHIQGKSAGDSLNDYRLIGTLNAQLAVLSTRSQYRGFCAACMTLELCFHSATWTLMLRARHMGKTEERQQPHRGHTGPAR